MHDETSPMPEQEMNVFTMYHNKPDNLFVPVIVARNYIDAYKLAAILAREYGISAYSLSSGVRYPEYNF